MNQHVITPIHVSVRLDPPSCRIGQQEVALFPSVFKVLLDRNVQNKGVVMTLLRTTPKGQMLRAYWICDKEYAECFVAALPDPPVVEKKPSMRATVMTKKDWRFYREEWLSMNRTEPGPCE